MIEPLARRTRRRNRRSLLGNGLDDTRAEQCRIIRVTFPRTQPVPLPSGTLLGAYEILGPIGAGGMGEVYRASDRRLNRIVAIKVLPPHLSADPDLRERFEREARTVSSLNDPHI